MPIDPWTGPTPISNQYPHHEPDGIKKLLGRLDALRTELRESTSNLLRTAGIRLTRAGMVIDSDLMLIGTLTADRVITAPALADGSVTARALADGSVGYAALVAPTLPAAVNLTSTAFAPTSTWAEVVGLDLTVPADCTRLLMTATCWCYSINNSASADDLHTRVSLGATDGQEFLAPLAVAGYGTISAGLAALADSLVPGTTIRLKASAKTTTGAWTTDAANTATLVASLTWLR